MFKKEWFRDLLILGIFSAAFGYIEGAVAHYLRLHFYPAGFGPGFSLDQMDISTVRIEMGREIATLAVILCAAVLKKAPKMVAASKFIFCFAVWDIIYYAALFVFESWPKTFLDWDVLFLVPRAWFAPVLAPVVISLMGIIGSVFVMRSYEENGGVKLPMISIGLTGLAFVLWLWSFMEYSADGNFPVSYNWPLFIAGILLSSAGLLWMVRETSVYSKNSTNY